jgi:hypothetical protein
MAAAMGAASTLLNVGADVKVATCEQDAATALA